MKTILGVTLVFLAGCTGPLDEATLPDFDAKPIPQQWTWKLTLEETRTLHWEAELTQDIGSSYACTLQENELTQWQASKGESEKFEERGRPGGACSYSRSWYGGDFELGPGTHYLAIWCREEPCNVEIRAHWADTNG